MTGTARYRVEHRTAYAYGDPMARAHNLVHLRPRPTATQVCTDFELVVDPPPAWRSERLDFFGNPMTEFTVHGRFDRLVVVATSKVEVRPRPAVTDSPPWERVRDRIARDLTPEGLDVRQYCFESPLVPYLPGAAAYAHESFPPGRPVHDAVLDLARRVHTEFTYEPGSTTARTPVEDAFARRRGVCQDFSHVMLACLRAMGLPGRYVSGYLESADPGSPGTLVGSEMSHAWAATFLPEIGWLEIDPTNDTVAGTTHVVTAWGRDYGDVAPVRGTIHGRPTSQHLEVTVTVRRDPVPVIPGR